MASFSPKCGPSERSDDLGSSDPGARAPGHAIANTELLRIDETAAPPLWGDISDAVQFDAPIDEAGDFEIPCDMRSSAAARGAGARVLGLLGLSIRNLPPSLHGHRFLLCEPLAPLCLWIFARSTGHTISKCTTAIFAISRCRERMRRDDDLWPFSTGIDIRVIYSGNGNGLGMG
jgi:hypothetical protein